VVSGTTEISAQLASRLLSLNSSNQITSTALNSWVSGTADELTVTDDGDGTITLSLPSLVNLGDGSSFLATTTSTDALTVNSTFNFASNTGFLYADSGSVSASSTIRSAYIEDVYLRNDGDDMTSGQLTAANFVGSSTSATSTFAGGLAIENSGLVYDWQTNRVGIGTDSPTIGLDVDVSSDFSDLAAFANSTTTLSTITTLWPTDVYGFTLQGAIAANSQNITGISALKGGYESFL